MDQLKTDHTVCAIVEAMLPRFGSKPRDLTYNMDFPSLALYFCLDMRAFFFADNGDEARESVNLHFIFERPTNYTKVWYAANDSGSVPKASEFRMLSDHDSCWRSFSSEILTPVIEMRDKVRATVKAEFSNPPEEKVVRRKMSDFNNIHAIEWVQVLYKKNPEDTHRKILTDIKPFPTNEAMVIVAQNITERK